MIAKYSDTTANETEKQQAKEYFISFKRDGVMDATVILALNAEIALNKVAEGGQFLLYDMRCL